MPAAAMALASGWTLEERVSPRARHIRIEVHTGNVVRLIVPRGVALDSAHAFLRSRAAWIDDKLREQRERQSGSELSASTTLRWDGTDGFPLRGEQVPLLVEVGGVRSLEVELDAAAIRMRAPSPTHATPRVLGRALESALRRAARRDAQHYLQTLSQAHGIAYLGPRLGDPRSRWGSCTARGLISLSWRLVLAPPDVFQYVAAHELSHCRHLNHSSAFWDCVESLHPGFREPQRWLRDHGNSLHGWLAKG